MNLTSGYKYNMQICTMQTSTDNWPMNFLNSPFKTALKKLKPTKYLGTNRAENVQSKPFKLKTAKEKIIKRWIF